MQSSEIMFTEICKIYSQTEVSETRAATSLLRAIRSHDRNCTCKRKNKRNFTQLQFMRYNLRSAIVWW